MAARLLAPISDSFPMQHGMLRVSAASIHSESPNEAFDVVVSGRGELSAVLLELRAQRPAVSVYDALSRIRRALVDGVPIYELLLLLKTWCLAPERHAVLGIALLRFSQSDSRVEILNAGLPAIASALPGGRIALHPALSGAIGAREEEVRPYELLPLIWGSTWFSMSNALIASPDAEAPRRRVIEHRLDKEGANLSRLTSEELAPRLRLVAGGPGSSTPIRADASNPAFVELARGDRVSGDQCTEASRGFRSPRAELHDTLRFFLHE